jgi:hypothetical protein
LQAKYPAVITGPLTDPETATNWQDGSTPYYVAQAKWTSTVTSRLLVETGFTKQVTLVTIHPMPGVEAPFGTPEWYSRVQKTDLDRGTIWNGVGFFRWWPIRNLINSSASYVTGTHNVKVGTQIMWGGEERYWDQGGHLTQQRYRSGVPDAVTVTNYPVRQDPRLNYDVGIYAQDQWTIDRLTLNGGVRVEWLNSEVAEQRAGVGRFVGERHFAKVPNVPDWFDVSPRFGLAYDLFGDAKTAIKFSAGRFVTPHTTSFAQRFNPMAIATSPIPWNDRDVQGRTLPTNGDDIAQDNEIDLTRLPRNFGLRQLDTFDPNIKREYNIETNVSVQHELLRNVSVSAGWYHRTFNQFYLDDNRERDFNDYVPVQIVSPYNGEVITAYNLKSAAELSLVDILVTNASEDRSEVYNGFEVGVEARLPGGGMVLGSTTTQRIITEQCDDRDDPNKLRFCDRGNLQAPYKGVDFKSDFKLAGSYPLPFGSQVTATFKSYPGRTDADLARIDELLPLNWNISRATRYTAADCAGRPCTPGALVIPGLVQTSLIVPLAPAGTERHMERLTQLDVGVRKNFRSRGVEWQAQLDVYNALNADTVTAERSANFGTPTYGVPASILLGRIPRLAVQMKW